MADSSLAQRRQASFRIRDEVGVARREPQDRSDGGKANRVLASKAVNSVGCMNLPCRVRLKSVDVVGA